jgi:hypothetical protein
VFIHKYTHDEYLYMYIHVLITNTCEYIRGMLQLLASEAGFLVNAEVCIWIYVYIHLYIYVFVHINMYVSKCTYICIYMYIETHKCTYTYIYFWSYLHIHRCSKVWRILQCLQMTLIFLGICLYTYICIYICVMCIYIHTIYIFILYIYIYIGRRVC